MVNSPTPCCLGQCHSSTASLASNRLLFSSLVFHNLFALSWEFCHLCTTCTAIVCVHRCIHWPGNQCTGEKDCQMSLNHNCCRKLLLYQFLWSPLLRIVDIELNLYLRQIGTTQWGTFYNLVQMYLRRKVDTKHCLYQRCIVLWNKMYTLLVSIDL